LGCIANRPTQTPGILEIGATASAICRIEKGDRDPLATTAARLARVFDVPIEHLVHE
jgi:DNA-binding XRE family transcriptional regulator